MRNLRLKTLVLCATLVGTSVTGYVLWSSWTLASTPPPTLEELTLGDRTPAALRVPAAPVVALDEVYVSLGSAPEQTRSLVVNLELELFDERSRETVDKFRSPVRDLVLQAAMEQPYEAMRTLPGKLSFKEVLVSRINLLLHQPVVRNVHFASFYLQ